MSHPQNQSGGDTVSGHPNHNLNQHQHGHNLDMDMSVSSDSCNGHDFLQGTHRLQQYNELVEEDVKRNSVPLTHRLAGVSHPASLHQRSSVQEQQAPGDAPGDGHAIGGHALSAFNIMILEQTETIHIPEGSQVPHCECSQPCRLVQYNPLRGIDKYVSNSNDDGGNEAMDEQCDLFVCSRSLCMFFQIVGVDQPEPPTATPEAVNEWSLTEFWAHADSIMQPLTQEKAEIILGKDYMDFTHLCMCEDENGIPKVEEKFHKESFRLLRDAKSLKISCI